MENESSLLIQRDNSVNQVRFQAKYALILPAMFFLFLGVFSNNYLINEWVQEKIKKEHFPDLSTNKNYSACGVKNHSDKTYQDYTIVQQTSARWITYFSIAQHVPTFFMNLILNGYTDTFGRKFLLVTAGFGMCVKFSIITTVIYLDASLIYVLVMFAVDGLLGSKYAVFATLFAYTADITQNDNQRIFSVVGLEILFVITTILSSYLTGLYVETLQLGFFNTAFINTASCVFGFVIILFLVPESLSNNRKRPAQKIIGSLKTLLQFYVGKDFKGKRLVYILLFFAFAFAELSGICRGKIETLYFLGQPFCWGPSKIGTYLMTQQAVVGVVGIISLKVFQKFLSNEVIAGMSNISNALSLIIEGIATTNLMIYMVPVAGIISFLVVPMIRGIMSVITDPDKQGAMFSSVAAVEVLSVCVGTMAENEIYAETYAFMNGFVFLIMSGFSVIDAVLMFVLYIIRKKQAQNSI